MEENRQPFQIDPNRGFGRDTHARQHTARWIIISGGILFILAVAAAVITGIIAGTRVYDGLQTGQQSLMQARDAAISLEFEEARTSLYEAQTAFNRAEQGLDFVFWMKPIPWVGDQIQGVEGLLHAGQGSLNALLDAVDMISDMYGIIEDAQALLAEHALPSQDLTFYDIPVSYREELLRSVHANYANFVETRAKLDIVENDIAALQELSLLPEMQDVVDEFAALIPKLQHGIDVIIPLSAGIGELTGVDQDRQWLILYLNNTELRPGGGFIGVYGLATMRDGEIVQLSIDDSYAVDTFVQDNPDYSVTPPQPVEEFMGVDTWYFRDANWSPDFPQSAQDAVQLMRQEFAFGEQPVPEIHGVIGFTPDVAEDLLDIVGPINIQGLEFTSENVTALLEFQVEFAYEDLGYTRDQRKAIVGLLTQEVMQRVFALPVSEWGSVLDLLYTNFDEKHMAVYSYDAKTQNAFEDHNWAADVDIAKATDHFMVVDANMAALKTDAVMDKHIDYTIVPDGNRYKAQVDILYRNTGTFSLTTSRYRTYTRLYAPLGSELITVEGSLQNDKFYHPAGTPDEVTIQEELGMTSFGVFTSVEPGKEKVLSFSYYLPDNIANAIDRGVYTLDVLKQIGALDPSLTLNLQFDKTITAAYPGESKEYFGDKAYTIETALQTDKRFTIEF